MPVGNLQFLGSQSPWDGMERQGFYRPLCLALALAPTHQEQSLGLVLARRDGDLGVGLRDQRWESLAPLAQHQGIARVGDLP